MRALLKVKLQYPGGIYKGLWKQDGARIYSCGEGAVGVRKGRCGGELSLGGWVGFLPGKARP